MTHVHFEVISFYNILRYVIAHILRYMCNLHIKEAEISQKRSKGIKNWKITYSVILSVLSNKTNLILGFSTRLVFSTHIFTSLLFSYENIYLFIWIEENLVFHWYLYNNSQYYSTDLTFSPITKYTSRPKITFWKLNVMY